MVGTPRTRQFRLACQQSPDSKQYEQKNRLKRQLPDPKPRKKLLPRGRRLSGRHKPARIFRRRTTMQPPMRVTTTACKGIQMRTTEPLRRLSQLQSSFSMQKFQERLKYEFTEENLSFEIEELFNTGEKVSKTFVACIVLACKYVTCSRRHSIARVNQMLQFQVFRDFQADIRRLRKLSLIHI